ncbi:hypothetical protein DPEC_G00107160 [Dallia pectoralis]|uniref:Uncharacterized protein n=2 Tax=Dallia pectoralis TaxID=75939 RepID=A0ACC2GS89_DALPE|nr:hypothetical protein DPEC_G00107160 [Dallia pectoralis]
MERPQLLRPPWPGLDIRRQWPAHTDWTCLPYHTTEDAIVEEACLAPWNMRTNGAQRAPWPNERIRRAPVLCLLSLLFSTGGPGRRLGQVIPLATHFYSPSGLTCLYRQSPKVPTLTPKTSMPGYQRRLSGLPCPTPGEVIRGRFLATKNPGVGGRKSLKRCLLRTALGRSPLVEAICSQLCSLITSTL